MRFVASCPFSAVETLEKAKAVLESVDRQALEGWPSTEDWRRLLPQWFVDRCAPEESDEETRKRVDAWRKLPREAQWQIELGREWSLKSWLYWMEPKNRTWFWWDAASLSEIDHLLIALEIWDWPFPWQSFSWSLRAAGASSVFEEPLTTGQSGHPHRPGPS